MSNAAIAAHASARSGTTPAAPAPGSPAAALASKPGLRMRPQRPLRALAGALVVVASVVAALALYARIGNRSEVLAVSRDVLAGEQISDADLQVVSISSDGDVPTVPASQRAAFVGQYARVRMLAGSLLAADSVQAAPDRRPRTCAHVRRRPGRPRSRSVCASSHGSFSSSRRRLREATAPHRCSSRRSSPPFPATSASSSARRTQGREWSPSASRYRPEYVGIVGEAEAVSVGVLDGAAPFPAEQVGATPAGDPARARRAVHHHGGRRRCGCDESRRPDDAPDDRDDDDGGTTGMTIVAVATAGGTSASTTTALLLSAMLPAGYPTLFAECDPSGGDVAGWAQLPTVPGWSSAVSASDRSWSAIVDNVQQLAIGTARHGGAVAGGAGAHRRSWRRRATSLCCCRRCRTSSPSPTAAACTSIRRRGRHRRSWRCCSCASASPRLRRRCHGSTGRSKRSVCCAVRAARSASC